MAVKVSIFLACIVLLVNGQADSEDDSFGHCSRDNGSSCMENQHLYNNLIVLTVATSPTDGFRRFMRSTEKSNLHVEVLGMGQEWTGGDIERYAGGGMKVNLLKAALEKYKDKTELLLMFVDSYDLVFLRGAEDIINTFQKFNARVLFSAEGFCWPDRSLADHYPNVREDEKRFLNSGGFMGYASDLYAVVTHHDIGDKDDDQLYYTKMFLDADMREKHKMKLDTKSAIFQNLNGALDDVQVMYKESTSYLYNHKTRNSPIVVHGNGPIKVPFNRLTNYLVNSYTPTSGCLACKENVIDLNNVQDEALPLVFTAMFFHHPTAFIEDFFANVAAQNYPKSRMVVFLHYTAEYHEKHVAAFVEKYSSMYKSITVVPPSEGINQWQGRNKAIGECQKAQCDYMFALDGDVQLENAETLRLLIQYNRSVIAPMVTRHKQLWSNFWGDLSNDGFYRRSEDYLDFINRKRVGQWVVPHISEVLLINSTVLPRIEGGYINGQFDPDMALCKTLREKDTFMYMDNQHYYGHLVNSENFNTERLHGDLYEIFNNEYTWEKKYVHANYTQQMDKLTTIEQPCPDVYYIPIVTDTFADHLKEEMEYYGQWSAGKPEDSRLQGGYENVPTVDIHTNQIGWEKHWLQFLKKFVGPLSGKVYTGYYTESRAIMNFVVRYKPGEQDRLRPHHDSSTYSIIISLSTPNTDYQGGGTNFLRYNCKVTESRKGWMLMFPGRLTHYHEGLPTTKGTRYIMVSFIDP